MGTSKNKKGGRSHGKQPAQTAAGKSKVTVGRLLERAEQAVESSEYGLAIKFYEKALQMQPNDVELMDTVADLLLELGDIDKSQQWLEKSIAVSPDAGHTKYMNMGQLSEGHNAIRWFRRGIEVLLKNKPKFESENQLDIFNRSAASAWVSIAEIYMTDACFDADAAQQCESALTQAAKFDPDEQHPEVWQTFASYWMSMQNKENATSCMNKVVAIIDKFSERDQSEANSSQIEEANKPSYEFRIAAAKLLMELSQHTKSQEILDELLLEDDQSVDAQYLMGVCLSMKGEHIEAEEFVSKALELAKKQGDDPEFQKEIQEELRKVRKDADTQRTQNNEEPNNEAPDEEWEDVSDDEEMDES